MSEIPTLSPYEILGIQKTDNLQEIKQAYKILALKYHPDKNPHGVDKFQEVNKAYQILSNPETKLFFDSFGYDGLMFNQKLGSSNYTGTEWIIAVVLCLVPFIIDYIFSIYIEWILVSLFILGFLYISRRQLEYLFFVYIGIANLIFYFIFPTKLLPFTTNFIIYGIILLWPNITKKNSSMTVTLWFTVMFLDFLRDIEIKHWLWHIIGLNIIIFGSIILLLLGIYVLKKPESGPSFYSNILSLIFASLNNSELDISLYLIFWCPIWLLDHISGRRIEWLIPPVFCVVKLILFQAGTLKIALPLILSTTGVYYFIPKRIYQFLSNYIIHLLFHMVIYKANLALINNREMDEEQKSKLLIEKSVKQFITGFIFLVFQYFLGFSTEEWVFLGSLSLGYSLLIMAELYFFNFSIKTSDSDTALQPYVPPNSEETDNNNNFINNNSNNSQSTTPVSTVTPTITPIMTSTTPISVPPTTSSLTTGTTTVNTTPSKSSLVKACQTCFVKSKPLKKCSRCKKVYYCSKDCQKKNWDFHRMICSEPNK
ncbi:hypothetical protein DLAC_02140 [Tieghemostelium lacteum]|uniref:J domain-containing protein n=1 Tax=Tieghemostelium lacteum TaxID=361077 RepID=A0A152A4R3_TIELA|nr:hypothetical protein DLAC_02140 [Tieghemostelium lacteum]|eukprot:KYR01051.1 hypothetical protein DLAC_02140 [Tieghemostelium lacteum]